MIKKAGLLSVCILLVVGLQVGAESPPELPVFPTIDAITYSNYGGIRVSVKDVSIIDLILFEDGSIGVVNRPGEEWAIYFESWIEWVINQDMADPCYPVAMPPYQNNGQGITIEQTIKALTFYGDSYRLQYDIAPQSPMYDHCTRIPFVVR